MVPCLCGAWRAVVLHLAYALLCAFGLLLHGGVLLCGCFGRPFARVCSWFSWLLPLCLLEYWFCPLERFVCGRLGRPSPLVSLRQEVGGLCWCCLWRWLSLVGRFLWAGFVLGVPSCPVSLRQVGGCLCWSAVVGSLAACCASLFPILVPWLSV